jgi:hypothetical protein
MNETGESQEVLRRLQTAVSAYLDERVSKRAFETVTKDLTGRLALRT